MRKYAFLFIFTFFPLCTFATEVNITVNGMVCSLCAHGLEKKFNENEAVEKIEVEFEKRLVRLVLVDHREISDEEIQKVVSWAGYEVAGIERKKSAPPVKKP